MSYDEIDERDFWLGEMCSWCGGEGVQECDDPTCRHYGDGLGRLLGLSWFGIGEGSGDLVRVECEL